MRSTLNYLCGRDSPTALDLILSEISSTIKARIIRKLYRSGAPLSVREIIRNTPSEASDAYKQINLLCSDNKVIKVATIETGKGKPSTIYTLTPEYISDLNRTLSDDRKWLNHMFGGKEPKILIHVR